MSYTPMVQISFRLDGFRRFSAEELWARRRNDGLFEVRCVPFLAAGVHFGDVLELSADGAPRVVLPSGHQTERILLAGALEADQWDACIRGLEEHGTRVHPGSNGFCAVDVLPSGNRPAVVAQLGFWSRQGKLVHAADEPAVREIAMALDDSGLPHWPFDGARTRPVVTVCSVLEGASVLHVVRDNSAAGWQFLGWETPSEEDGRLTTVPELLSADRSLAALAELPVGWHAWRQAPTEEWQCAAL